jgi:hypothetical protein
MEGFDKLQKKLNDLQRNIKDLEGKNEVSFKELFTQEFIKGNTNFENLDDMFKKSGFEINSQEDFKKIPNEQWDSFISSNTKFKNWEEMLDAAVNVWTRKKLDF